MNIQTLKILSALCGLLFFASCASLPTAQTSQLSSSGKVLRGSLSESFDLTTSILYERTYMRNTESNKTLTNYLDTTNDLLRKEFDKRLVYAGVLEAYFEALNTLASRSDVKAIKESGINLDASLMGMQQYLPPGDQGKYKTLSAGFGTASDFILRRASQGIQRKYLRLSMDKAKPALDSICHLLEHDLAECDELLNSNQQSVISRLIAVRNTETDITKKRDWDLYIGRRVQGMKLLDHSYKTAQMIVKNIPIAHDEVRAALDNKMNLKDAITTVVSEIKDLKECYDEIIASQNKGK